MGLGLMMDLRKVRKLRRCTSSHLVPFFDGFFVSGPSSGFSSWALISAWGFVTLGSGLGATTTRASGAGAFVLDFSETGCGFAGLETSTLTFSSSGLLFSGIAGFGFSNSGFLAFGSPFACLGTSGSCFSSVGFNFSGSGFWASGWSASSGT